MNKEEFLDIFVGGGKAVNKEGIIIECYNPKICTTCSTPNTPVSRVCFRCKNKLNKRK